MNLDGSQKTSVLMLRYFGHRYYQFAHIRKKTLTSAFKCPIRVSTIYLGYLTNQPLCGPEGGGGRGVGWASGVYLWNIRGIFMEAGRV